ncbi:MAG: hypothetical protein Q4B50_06550 [Bacillota bacterium]|nr:hypothetical protein [Bacillota bacterium]
MAEKIIPFARTLLLPAGSPAIGCVDGLRMDVSRLRCHYTGQSCCCTGDVDVLIEYHAAPPVQSSLFAGPAGPGKAWQALLTLPVELDCGSGEELPFLQPGSYQPQLRNLEWFMVASNAIELEGSLLLSWEPQQKAEEVKGFPDAFLKEAALSRELVRQRKRAASGGKQEEKVGGGTMEQDQQRKQKGSGGPEDGAAPAMEARIQHLVDTAEQTAAAAQQLWRRIEEQQVEEDMPEEASAQDAAGEKAGEASTCGEALVEKADGMPGKEPAEAVEVGDEELREGVVLRMRFDSPERPGQGRIYYQDGQLQADPKALAEVLWEALGEDSPHSDPRLSFSWGDSLRARDFCEKEEKEIASEIFPASGKEAEAPAALMERSGEEAPALRGGSGKAEAPAAPMERSGEEAPAVERHRCRAVGLPSLHIDTPAGDERRSVFQLHIRP